MTYQVKLTSRSRSTRWSCPTCGSSTGLYNPFKPACAGGLLLGIVPSLDAIQYHTMLLLDQALGQGLELAEAMRFTGHHAEHRFYDFAFGRFKFQGLRQKFWFPFEVEHRLGKAGFRGVRLKKVLYPWDDAQAGSAELSAFPPSWDWFFQARSQSGSRRRRSLREDIAS